MRTNIYTTDGWLNVPALAELPAWLRVIIGKRQVGKTYGTLKYMIESGRRFILMRRTVEEVQFLGANSEVNPFAVFAPDHNIRMDRAGKILNIYDEDRDQQIGICLGLPTVATIRGFAAQGFTDIVYDEFIPEKHDITRKTEGDALLNAYTTINGNRELQGRPPVNLWLLANTNNINSSVLQVLDLIDPILKMREKGKEIWNKDGVLICQPGSEKVTEKRRKTALMAHLEKTKSAERFTGMALDNEWAYNEQALVGKMSMKGLTPLCSYGDIYIWQTNDGQSLYACHAQHRVEHYETGEYETERFTDDYYWIFEAYRAGLIKFADLHIQDRIKQIFKINF